MIDATKLRKIVEVLSTASRTMDGVLDTLPKSHDVYPDLSAVGNWVRAAHRRLEKLA